jgi:DNA polymerase-3 subunit gamma/tau
MLRVPPSAAEKGRSGALQASVLLGEISFYHGEKIMQLFERYRPQRFDDVAGQDAAIAQVKRLLRKGWGGRAWWLVGPSGSGKTTIARIIAQQGCDALSIQELDSQNLTPAAVRECVESYRCRSLFGNGGKAFIVNEAHGLRRDTIRELLTALEPAGGLPSHIVWIFTTTDKGEIKLFADDDDAGNADALLSRCDCVKLNRNDSAFASRARKIAQEEGIDGKCITAYDVLANECDGNMRRMLQRIEAETVDA